MRKTLTALALLAAVSAATVAPAIAADLSNGNGQNCDGTANWHFVNNQTGGAAAGELWAVFNIDGLNNPFHVTADTVNKNNQHFNVETEGNATLISATTNLPGKLVLSDFTCDDGGKKDPPKK